MSEIKSLTSSINVRQMILKGESVRGVELEEDLDLSGINDFRNIDLSFMRVAGSINLGESCIGSLFLVGTVILGTVNAEKAFINGGVFLLGANIGNLLTKEGVPRENEDGSLY